MEDVPLDEFADAEEGEETVEAEDDPGERVATEEVSPAVSTYAWTAEGAVCADCGEAVERRWEDDGTLVCADCKAW